MTFFCRDKLFAHRVLQDDKNTDCFAFKKNSLCKFYFYFSRKTGVCSPHPQIIPAADGDVNSPECKWISFQDGYDIYYFEYRFAKSGLYFIKCPFSSVNGTDLFRFADNRDTMNVTVYEKNFRTPDKFKGGVMYQIFCDRFAKSKKHTLPVKKSAVLYENWENGIPDYPEKPGDPLLNNCFFGGSLYGIIEKLDYLQSLGVNIIYLNPIFEAFSNHKYDTADYLNVDPMFGGNDALTELITELKKRGMFLILDGVFNHTGDDSIYFNKYGNYPGTGAYQSKDSVYHDWYTFRKFPDDYECWWGVKILPSIKKNSESFRNFICGENGVVAHYLSLGADGFRLDVADELSDRFLSDLRKISRKCCKDPLIIGEVWEDASDKIAYGSRRSYFQGKQLDSVMNYPLKNAIIDFMLSKDAEAFSERVISLYLHYPKQVSDVLMNILGTHDTERILTVLADAGTGNMSNAELAVFRLDGEQRERAFALLKIAAFILYTLPGIPCVYYGDEVGMEGGRDPFNRLPFPENKICTESLRFFRKLGVMRSEFFCFADGDFEILCSSESLFFFRRGKVYFAANAGNDKLLTSETPFTEYFSNTPAEPDGQGKFCFRLPSMGIAVLIKHNF